MSTPNYNIYPSLLNKFQDLCDAAQNWDKFYGAQDDPPVTVAEYEARVETELIDSINRVPKAPIEAADKGTCFNEIIDAINRGTGSQRDDVKFHSTPGGILATMDGFEFLFSRQLCVEAAEYFRGCLPQVLCEADLDTRYGTVHLYGYADEVGTEAVADIKTTGSYDFGKFGRYWQHRLYPWCLVESGMMQRVTMFEYTVYKLRGGNMRNPVIDADMYIESYMYDHERAGRELRQACEMFIAWLEQHRDLITDRKVFNLQ